MSKPLCVRGLCKQYEGFSLRDVSFALRPGAITGFIGRNGAGKTTTLKCLLNLVHPDGGEIRFWDAPFADCELEVKRRIGFVSGGVDYYPTKKLGAITAVTRRFYPAWDERAYREYLRRFGLSEDKTPRELSEGMKVKYALALALSHSASLLLLDEPTSGLDPVSRDELLDIFLSLARDGGVTILFSTHITSDLEKCADDILYIKNGSILDRGSMDRFLSGYRIARWTGDPPAGPLIGPKRERSGMCALVRSDDPPRPGVTLAPADLESVMVHMERE